MKNFLQTKDWLEFQESLGRKGWHFEGTNIIKHDLPLGKSYLYIPHGPSEPNRSLVPHLRELAEQENSFFVKAEPLEDVIAQTLVREGFRVSSKTIQPYHTVVIDLTYSELELLAKLHHKTRYNINLATKKGLSFQKSNDVEIFWQLLSRTAVHDKFSSHPKEHYQKLLEFFQRERELKTHLFLTHYETRPVAGAIILTHGTTAYYLHGAMDREFRSIMAPHFMHWEIIKWLKQSGFTQYDLWGIDATKWPGVTRFKLGFGGRVVEYPGAFDLPISKFWYWVYNLTRTFI